MTNRHAKDIIEIFQKEKDDKMKKLFSLLLLVAVAVALCACNNKDKTAEETSQKALFLNGSWNCTELSDQMKKNYNSAKMEIKGDDFTYTLKGDKSTLVFSGYTESIGSNCLALHVEHQKETDSKSGEVIQDQSLPSNFSKSQSTILKPEGLDGMVAESGGTSLHFAKEE